jgi:antitoxin MazE
MNLHIAKWGNSLAVRIPAEYVRRIGLKDGDLVQANLTLDGALTIRPDKWNRTAFASELEQARQGMQMGSAVMEELRSGARY